MKPLTAAVGSLSMMILAHAQTDKTAVAPGSTALPPVLTLEDVSKITAQGARCPEELEQMTGQ
jgi:hypothetical protein